MVFGVPKPRRSAKLLRAAARHLEREGLCPPGYRRGTASMGGGLSPTGAIRVAIYGDVLATQLIFGSVRAELDYRAAVRSLGEAVGLGLGGEPLEPLERRLNELHDSSDWTARTWARALRRAARLAEPEHSPAIRRAARARQARVQRWLADNAVFEGDSGADCGEWGVCE